jgi:hypothetical protein
MSSHTDMRCGIVYLLPLRSAGGEAFYAVFSMSGIIPSSVGKSHGD